MCDNHHFQSFVCKFQVFMGIIEILMYCRANVILTDLNENLDLLYQNIQANQTLCRGNVEAKQLRWGINDDLKDLPKIIDFVLISDCIYYEASLEPLVETLKSICQPGITKILLSYEDRSHSAQKLEVQKKFFDLIERDFDLQRYTTSDCHPDYAANDIKLIRLTRNKLNNKS